jgi:hypothetical protein
MRDLVVLAADKSMEFALRGALPRSAALGIRPITFDFRVHAGRDGGARSSGADVLRSQRRQFDHALLILDFDGCGARAEQTALDVEAQLDAELSLVWQDKAKAIVIDPELENWVWGSDNALQTALGWPLPQSIRTWLTEQGYSVGANGKPDEPKAAFEALVPVHKMPRSSAVYESITSKISLATCQDEAFQRLKQALRHWFPASPKP